VDFVIANGENICVGEGNGISAKWARELHASGVDCITTGNHAWRQSSIYNYMDDHSHILRPINYASASPGVGSALFDVGSTQILAINAAGRGMTHEVQTDCPFNAVEEALRKYVESSPLVIIDFHAESTSEKAAFAYHFDGRVSAIFGTHTHVQTADERVLPRGTGFITDIGMTGVTESCLGVATECIIAKFRTGLPQRFVPADGEIVMTGALFDVDVATGQSIDVQRVRMGL